MDDENKALIQAIAHEAAAPYRKVAEVILGWAFLDAFEEKRENKRQRRLKNRENIARETMLVLQERRVDPKPEDVIPEYVEQVMEAGETTSIPEIQQLFARLLATALDKNARRYFRQEFIEILKQFEPLDALVLQSVSAPDMTPPRWVRDVAIKISRSDDEVTVSGENLERLGLMMRVGSATHLVNAAMVTPKGRQLLSCIGN